MEVGGTWEPWRLEVREDEGNECHLEGVEDLGWKTRVR